MDRDQLNNFINQHKETGDFTGGVGVEQIDYVEQKLNLKLPNSYKWFLTNYGSGGLFGVDIIGVPKSNIASVVKETDSYRELGMSENLVVIEDIDEYAYCLDTSKMENNECPVIAWNRQGGLDDYYTAKSFNEFLYQRLLDAKEAWEEDF
ncbi:SMI1/KNR4 family protein [Alkalihalophilus lindianensis]|uniref:SMI1/KNR4 family protein n=1 Tax=Alkalihalophilus lindianensis TaxID=1630542 RepID=A0ABU3XF55_9BACI|nr:SMI1/KNR4 family protein [Alkalihalophilus lindianensis]MDV2686473.1 SMI1/KNR4 family protein [Alkalihalophilus lindianensis]